MGVGREEWLMMRVRKKIGWHGNVFYQSVVVGVGTGVPFATLPAFFSF